MIQYTIGFPDRPELIAHLHATSWQRHYRGIFSDHYLDQEVLNDRLDVWNERYIHPADNQHIICAWDGDQLCGFACTFLAHDPAHGALLDNLHVLSEWQGHGIGRRLMIQTAQWVQTQASDQPLYLWVLEENSASKDFYERMGGQQFHRKQEACPGGGTAWILGYKWNDLNTLTNSAK